MDKALYNKFKYPSLASGNTYAKELPEFGPAPYCWYKHRFSEGIKHCATLEQCNIPSEKSGRPKTQTQGTRTPCSMRTGELPNYTSELKLEGEIK